MLPRDRLLYTEKREKNELTCVGRTVSRPRGIDILLAAPPAAPRRPPAPHHPPTRHYGPRAARASSHRRLAPTRKTLFQKKSVPHELSISQHRTVNRRKFGTSHENSHSSRACDKETLVKKIKSKKLDYGSLQRQRNDATGLTPAPIKASVRLALRAIEQSAVARKLTPRARAFTRPSCAESRPATLRSPPHGVATQPPSSRGPFGRSHGHVPRPRA